MDAERCLGQLLVPERAGEPGKAGGVPERYADLPVQVATLRAIVARYSNDFAAARAHAEVALGQFPENLPLQANAQLRGLVFLALATAYDGAGDLAWAVDAYAETIRWSRLGRNAAGVAGVTYRLSGVLRLLGRLRAAEAACREALQFMEEQGMARLPGRGILHLALAEVLLERNELAAAAEHLARGSELGQRSGRFDTVRNAAAAQARLRLARGDVRGALAAVAESEAARDEPPSPLALAELFSLKAKVLVWQGLPSEAAQCVAEAVHLAGSDRGLTGEMVALAAARLQLSQCRPDEAVTQLTRALAAAEGAGRWGAAIELRILRSLAHMRGGEPRGAEVDLQRALALAEPQGYVRLFVDEGQAMADLLRKLAAHGARSSEGGSEPAQFLTTLIAAFGAPGVSHMEGGGGHKVRRGAGADACAPAPAGPYAPTEALSAREVEVLQLMAEGLTNEQIAQRLIIALGTVKAHIHNIAGKLGAQNRADAVARAQELGIL